jgi:hypothetical protein
MATAQPSGSLYGRFFQWGYVTRDADRAMAQFSKRFGPAEFQVFVNTNPAPHPAGQSVKRVCMTWIGGIMAEVIEVDPNAASSFYRDALPAGADDIKLHHLGFLVDDYKSTEAHLKARGYQLPFAMETDNGPSMIYADARSQVGHYLEYVALGPGGTQWFSSVPGFQKFP